MRASANLTPGRRLLRRLRLVALIVIIFQPIVAGAWRIYVAAPVLGSGPRPVSDERVARYLERRHPVVDRLLPGGRGGTRFYEELGGNAGVASAGAAAIGLAVSVESNMWPESVELHERAHLLEAFAPAEAAAVLARVGRPAADEYAAKNPGEHFGEMAAKAWEIVGPPGEFCLNESPAARLVELEARVPGTAGFVVRYLQEMRGVEVEGRDEVAAIAARLTAPSRDAWSALWRVVDARRRADGGFEPWGPRSIREYIAAERQAAWTQGWLGRAASVALVPSWVLAMVVETIGG